MIYNITIIVPLKMPQDILCPVMSQIKIALMLPDIKMYHRCFALPMGNGSMQS